MIKINSNIIKLLLTLLISFYLQNLLANNSPTLLKKNTEKKEKLREEELVTKDLNIDDLMINQFINLQLVKSIFPEATSYGKIDTKTLSVPIYKENEEIGFLFETFDVTRGLGYSRRPFHLAVGIDKKGILRNVKLLKHVEPIAILGRTDQDFINYLKQYKNIDLKSGISLTLELTGADIEGDSVAMRETAGDVESLTKIDGISRTTTSSLLFMDAIMRGARKVARQKNIILDENDLGNYVDLETYKPQLWNDLIKDSSLGKLNIKVEEVQNKFEAMNTKPPRFLRFEKPNSDFANMYFSAISPAGIGINILGRRWFDQYISAGRNVDDQVFYIAFEGDLWRKIDNRISNSINKGNIMISQDDKEIIINNSLFKELPFNHAKKGPSLAGQGLLYFSSKYNFNPHLPFKLIYKIKNEEDKFINFVLNYKLPDPYRLKSFSSNINDKKKLKTFFKIFNNNKYETVISCITVISVIFIFLFSQTLSKNRKLFSYIRVLFLGWVTLLIGLYYGGQISVIHLVNLFKTIIYGGDSLITFFIEPMIFIFGVTTIVSLFFIGRTLFCGWLCPFGALQELLSTFAKKVGIKQYSIRKKLDDNLRYIKYFLLFIILILGILELEAVNKFYTIEPFKTVITLRFMAPISAIFWAISLLIISLVIERFFCRFLCPLGAGLAILGNFRLLKFLKRRQECGNPCLACNKICPTGAINKSGEIVMSECLGCLDCQVMYNDYKKCPPLVKISKRGIVENKA